jgi:hypothetical protein
MESPRETPMARIGAPLPRRERAAIRVERTGGAQAYRTLRTGNGRPAETGPRHRRRTTIPAEGSPSSEAPPAMGDPIRDKARGVDHGRRRSGAFAWQVSVARTPKVDKKKICSIMNFVCISLFLLHKSPTLSPQSYPHVLRSKGRPALLAQYLVACHRPRAQGGEAGDRACRHAAAAHAPASGRS